MYLTEGFGAVQGLPHKTLSHKSIPGPTTAQHYKVPVAGRQALPQGTGATGLVGGWTLLQTVLPALLGCFGARP